MENECQYLSTCGFFKKYQLSKDLACKGFIAMYCKGPKMNDCKRLEYRKKNGKPPIDDMMPSGHILSS
jgi:hypothetical protein